MRFLYSILTIENPVDGNSCVVVCETLTDEKDALRHAHNQGHVVKNVVPAEDARPITLNDYEL